MLRQVVLVSTRRLFSTTLLRTSDTALDPQQELLLKERCFLVDEQDKIIGTASKRDCHMVQKDGKIPLHRAFSVFLFNSKGDLLLQKRSAEKITFPNCYTNSCCSHPIADMPGEDEETDALGIKKAAIRRLNYELGIPMDSILLKNIHYLTRIHYIDKGDGIWGEHEIDYILFIMQDVKVNPNPNEISEISFVQQNEFDAYIPTLGAKLTPWFDLISKYKLKLWWKNLNNLDKYTDHKYIHFLKP